MSGRVLVLDRDTVGVGGWPVPRDAGDVEAHLGAGRPAQVAGFAAGDTPGGPAEPVQ